MTVSRRICLHIRRDGRIYWRCRYMLHYDDDCGNRDDIWPKFSLTVSSALTMYWAYSKIHGSGEDANFCIPQRCVFSADSCKWNRRLFVPELSFQKRPTDGQGEEEPPFLLPPPPIPRLPSVPISTNPQWRPKIPTAVMSNMSPVFRTAYQSKTQGGQGRYSTDLPKGNQQRAMEHHIFLMHSTGCC